MEQSAKLGASNHPVEQVPGVSACTGAGSQVLAAEGLHRLWKAQRGLSVLGRCHGQGPVVPPSIVPQLLSM